MKKVIYLGITMLSAMVLVGCSNTSSAPNTTSHSSNVKTEVKSSSTSKKKRRLLLKQLMKVA
ncbi:hypothetical protein V8V50_06445 [Ligilactobacillus salivarius]